MGKCLLLLILLAIGVGGAACAPQRPALSRDAPAPREGSLRFESELVRLRLKGTDSLEVEGFYRFLCADQAPARTGLYYPFPEADMGGARVLECEFRREDGPWQAMDFAAAPAMNGIVWSLPLEGARRCEVRTRYRQALLGPSARYIVTTTRGWARPLEHARFEIFLAPELAAPRFSHPFAPCDSLGPGAYCFEARSFWPDEDIVVSWEARD